MAIGADIIAAIAGRLAERAGLELPEWIVEARATSRMSALELSADQYLALLESPRGGAELEQLIEAVRVGESRLFRHRAQIAALVDDVVPALRAQGKRSIKVWSAGCSTGEEPYTLAAVLQRELPGCALSIIATDVSAEALAIAKRGCYPATMLADVPERWRDGFLLDGEVLRVRPEVAAVVKFDRANVVDSSNIRGCDIVWCRNVLIYFTADARRRVIDRLVAATASGGFVFVGYSESLRDVAQLHAVRAGPEKKTVGEAVYYVRGEPRGRDPDPAPRAPLERLDATPPPATIPVEPPTNDRLVLRGHPGARELTAELSARLGIAGLAKLVIDLDSAELLGDELAPVLRRARAAARAAHIELVLHATRSGTRRWIARHALDEDEP